MSKLLGGKTGCYGATIALTRSTLEQAGGFFHLSRRGAAFLLIFSGCPSLETGDSRAGSPTQ